MDKATCIWYLNESQWVKQGLRVQHLIDLEQISDWTAEQYHSWATEYYETDIDLTSVQKLFDKQFSKELARQLNPEVDLLQLKSEMAEIGINV